MRPSALNDNYKMAYTHKASIHYQRGGVKPSSERHCERTTNGELSYVRYELSKLNESFVLASNDEVKNEAQKFAKENSGRKLQKNANVIREAVLNIRPDTTMEDLKRCMKVIDEKYGLYTYQIHIHNDEGRWVDKNGFKVDPEKGRSISIQPPGAVAWQQNYHAHVHTRFQVREEKHRGITNLGKDKKTGKMTRGPQAIGTVKNPGKIGLSKMQDIVAEQLKMQRGERRVNSGRKRLEAADYKREMDRQELEQIQALKHQEEQKLKELQQRAELEQKKNQAAELEYRAAEEQYQNAQREDEGNQIAQLLKDFMESGDPTALQKEEKGAEAAIKWLEGSIHQQRADIEAAQTTEVRRRAAFLQDQQRYTRLREETWRTEKEIESISEKIRAHQSSGDSR